MLILFGFMKSNNLPQHEKRLARCLKLLAYIHFHGIEISLLLAAGDAHVDRGGEPRGALEGGDKR